MPQHTITFQTFPTPEQLPAADRELLARAVATLPASYSPYSNFRVAAAARLADGSLTAAANTENAAYPLCICAEPNALAAAAALRPGTAVVAMAITVRSPDRVLDEPATPCGGCRQILSEHEGRFGQSIRLVLRGETGPIYVFERAGDLLPFGFGAGLL